MRQGTVLEYHREYCWVMLDAADGVEGREVVAKPRARLELDEQQFARQISVGDRVELSEPQPGSFSIELLLPRETWLLRRSASTFSRKPQCIVANADQLAVVVATRPELRVQIVDRYFLAAIQGGLTPLLIVNKVDLDPRVCEDLTLLNYSCLGYSVHFCSAQSGEGVEALRMVLTDKLTAFCGHSGVGKSSLLRVLTGLDAIGVGDVNQITQKGRQTTITARIYQLPEGGQVLDTPGVREFGIHQMEWTEIHEYFADISALARGCAFQDCMHKVEPGCAVRDAVEQGRLAAGRLDSYIKLREEADIRDWER